MSFEHPAWLAGLLLLLPLGLIEWRAVVRADRSLRLLLGARPLTGLLLQLLPNRRVVALVLRLAALALLGLGAAGPRWGREAVRRQSQGSDVVFVIDVSASMQTRDVPPTRMDEARHEAVALLERLRGSRVGVVAFAGDAVRLCPLTLDQAAVRLTLETIGPGAVSEPGTDLGRALKNALKLLPAGRREEQAMVVWTDGEDLEGHARDVLGELKRSGLRVFAVGVGTPAGDVIPVTDEAGVTVDVKHDDKGGVVRSRLDEPLLRELARSTRGLYFSASHSGGELIRLASSLGSLARSRQGTRLVERPVARFPLCALGAAAALAAFFGAPRRRIVRRSAPLQRARRVGAAHARAAAALIACGLALAGDARAQSEWARGDAAFRRGDWARAESLYARRARLPRPPAALLANLATTRAEQAPDDSVEHLLSHLSTRGDAAGRMAGYNLGTLLGRRGDVDPALGELRRALERDPGDADARWNYEWLKRREDDAHRKPKQNQSENQDQKPPPQQSPHAGNGTPQPQPPPPSAPTTQSRQAEAPPPPGMQRPMTQRQAENLLGSLSDLERQEKQNQRRGRPVQQRRGRDW